MSPYIVTRGFRMDTGQRGAVSRRAAVTLEKARDYADEQVIACFDAIPPTLEAKEWSDVEYTFRDFAQAMPESGGTIGPLPGGTVIEVQPIHREELAAQAGHPRAAFVSTQVLCDDFNAAQRALGA